jgi:hypothetical protein
VSQARSAGSTGREWRLKVRRAREPEALEALVAPAHDLVERLLEQAAGLLGNRSVRDAARSFHALCEGLAAMELRSLLPTGDEERIWTDALATLVRGFATGP